MSSAVTAVHAGVFFVTVNSDFIPNAMRVTRGIILIKRRTTPVKTDIVRIRPSLAVKAGVVRWMAGIRDGCRDAVETRSVNR